MRAKSLSLDLIPHNTTVLLVLLFSSYFRHKYNKSSQSFAWILEHWQRTGGVNSEQLPCNNCDHSYVIYKQTNRIAKKGKCIRIFVKYYHELHLTFIYLN